MRFTKVAHYQSGAHDLWLGRRPDGSLVLEGFVKDGDDLKHLVLTVEDAEPSTALALVRRYGHVTRRPYQLGQACDGSICAPVFALFLDFCDRHGLDAQAMYDEAYPGERALEPEAITTFAHWQGVRIPHTWTAACYGGLLESLTEINNHILRSTLERAAQPIAFPTGVLEREGYVAFRRNTRRYSRKARFTWGYVVTPTGKEVCALDPWQSPNGVVPNHYWLSFMAIAAAGDGSPKLVRKLVAEAERTARKPAHKQFLRR